MTNGRTMETLGQKLKAARVKKGATASEAAAATRIKVQHIEAMKRDDFSPMPAAAYAKGFIRLYADYLGLPSEPLVDEYVQLHAPGAHKPVLDEEPSPEPRAPRQPLRMPKISIPRIALPKMRMPRIRLPRLRLPRFHAPKISVPAAALKRAVPVLVALVAVVLVVMAVRACGGRGDSGALTQRAGVRGERPDALIENPPAPYLEESMLPGR